MRELQLALVTANLAGKQPSDTWLKFFLSPSLIEECKAHVAVSVCDSNFENAAVSALHSSFSNFKDVCDYGGWLTEWYFTNRGEVASGGISTRVMLQKIADGLQPQMLRKRLGRAVT